MRTLFWPILILSLLTTSCTLVESLKEDPKWVTEIEGKVQALEKKFNGEFGVYVKDIESQADFSHKASEFWYLSSTVKVPVAMALLQLVDQKKLKLTEKVTITKKDYRDGAGPVNWIVPGEKVTYRYLLNKMLRYSDNAATDLIIKKVGLKAVNDIVKKHTSGKDFGEITTLLDVRKKAYGEFHPKAEELSNMSFFKIKKQRGPEKRLKQLTKELKVPKEKLKYQSYTEGFDKYYEKKWNSAPLTSYAELLEQLVAGKILNKKSTALLLQVMANIHTGKKRVPAGLPKKYQFAHKTGTQHKQACDVGVAKNKKTKKPMVLILVCTRKWEKLSEAEKLMSEVGKIISKSGVL